MNPDEMLRKAIQIAIVTFILVVGFFSLIYVVSL